MHPFSYVQPYSVQRTILTDRIAHLGILVGQEYFRQNIKPALLKEFVTEALLTTGDVLRITTIVAVHLSSEGTILLDVLLDHAGVPDGVDLAWRSKHYVGAPVVGATLATVNLAHVIAAVEFVDLELAEPPAEVAIPTTDEVVADLGRLSSEPTVAAQTTAGLLEEG
jgi:hypothetical protein